MHEVRYQDAFEAKLISVMPERTRSACSFSANSNSLFSSCGTESFGGSVLPDAPRAAVPPSSICVCFVLFLLLQQKFFEEICFWKKSFGARLVRMEQSGEAEGAPAATTLGRDGEAICAQAPPPSETAPLESCAKSDDSHVEDRDKEDSIPTPTSPTIVQRTDSFGEKERMSSGSTSSIGEASLSDATPPKRAPRNFKSDGTVITFADVVRYTRPPHHTTPPNLPTLPKPPFFFSSSHFPFISFNSFFIYSPDILATLSKEERMRQDVMYELVNTEDQYVQDLLTIIEVLYLSLSLSLHT